MSPIALATRATQRVRACLIEDTVATRTRDRVVDLCGSDAKTETNEEIACGDVGSVSRMQGAKPIVTSGGVA